MAAGERRPLKPTGSDSTVNWNDRNTRSFLPRRHSVQAEILCEIDCGFLDIQQRLGPRPFRINHIVAFELDMEKFNVIALGLQSG